MMKNLDKKKVALALGLIGATLLTGCGKKGARPGDGVGGVAGGIAGGVICPTGQGYAANAPIPFSGQVAIDSAGVTGHERSLQIGTQIALSGQVRTHATRSNVNGQHGALYLQTSSGPTSQVPAMGVLNLGPMAQMSMNQSLGYAPFPGYPGYPGAGGTSAPCVIGVEFTYATSNNTGAFYNGTDSIESLHSGYVNVRYVVNGMMKTLLRLPL